MTFLHQVKSETHLLEVGGLLEDLSALEAMKPPFLGHFKTAAVIKPKPTAAIKPKPKFIDHINRIKSKTVELLAACPAPWKDETSQYTTAPLDSEDAMGLSKWIITAAELTASGLSTSSAITKFKIRGHPLTATQSFTNFEAGLKAVTYLTPGCGGNAAGDTASGGCGSTATDTALTQTQFTSRDADQYATPGAFTLNNRDSWSELTLTTAFTWDGSSNIEVSLFHGTNGPSTYSTTTGLKTKYDPSGTASPSTRGSFQRISSPPTGFADGGTPRTWTNVAAASTDPLGSGMYSVNYSGLHVTIIGDVQLFRSGLRSLPCTRRWFCDLRVLGGFLWYQYRCFK